MRKSKVYLVALLLIILLVMIDQFTKQLTFFHIHSKRPHAEGFSSTQGLAYIPYILFERELRSLP